MHRLAATLALGLMVVPATMAEPAAKPAVPFNLAIWTARSYEVGEPIDGYIESSLPRSGSDDIWWGKKDEWTLALACRSQNGMQIELLRNCVFGYWPGRHVAAFSRIFHLATKGGGTYTFGIVDLRRSVPVDPAKPAPPFAYDKEKAFATCSNLLEVEVVSRPDDLKWGEPTNGLRCSVRRDTANTIQVRLQNVGKFQFDILPPQAECSGTITLELLDGKGAVIETEAFDRATNMERLANWATAMSPPQPARALEPSEVHLATLTVVLAASGSPGLHRLAKYVAGTGQLIRVRYDTRSYVEPMRRLQPHADIWTGIAVSNAVPIDDVKTDAAEQQNP